MAGGVLEAGGVFEGGRPPRFEEEPLLLSPMRGTEVEEIGGCCVVGPDSLPFDGAGIVSAIEGDAR